MSSAGHVFDAIARMKFNRGQMMARRERIADIKKMYSDSVRIEGYHYREKFIPVEVRERVKQKIRQDLIRKNRRTIVSSIITTFVIATLITIGIIYLFK